ncbi:MAG: CpsD/CapB family tyrosine-protein kinase [Acidimicrobiales bacterium]|nr:CpsD/CapB family tyrosine-protein kinase [Acidimicrobiales bacterium]
MARGTRTQASAASQRATRDEAFRVLRSNLLVAIDDLSNPIVVVTSAQAGEGKTSTSVMLARSLALAGPRVVLVDLDLRRPDAHRLLGADSVPGVADVLSDRREIQECLQFLPPPKGSPAASGLYFLPAGNLGTNPTELLGTPRTGRLLDALAKEADIVLLDTPPVLPVADTLVIGRLAAGAVLVVESRRTPVQMVNRAKAALIRNQTRILGVVLNQLRSSDDDGGYAYGYGYGYDREDA